MVKALGENTARKPHARSRLCGSQEKEAGEGQSGTGQEQAAGWKQI